MRKLVCALVAAVAATLWASDWDAGSSWYVATNGVDEAGRGTAAAPFKTLQFAHDQASTNDTIYLTPGIYDQGEVSDGNYMNRLVVSKKLRFISTGGKAVTEIVGRLHNGTTCGTTSIRCVAVLAAGYDSEFHDLTFRDGSAYFNTTEDLAKGGCIWVAGTDGSSAKTTANRRAFFVDCAIVGGVAYYYGGGMYGGTAIRCMIKNCKGGSWGSSASSSALWNCVVFADRCTKSDRPAVGYCSRVVNCTIYGGAGAGFARSCFIYNTFIANMGGTEFMEAIVSKKSYPNTCYNCVGGAATNNQYQVLSPATGDFRPIADAPIENGGLSAYLTNSIVLPADTVLTDYNGNPLDLTSETCNVGAVQGAGVTPATGQIVVNAGQSAEGFYNMRASYSYADHFPATMILKPVSADCARLSCKDGYSYFSFVYPLMDGNYHIGYPPASVATRSFTEVVPSRTLYAAPTADAATADGSAEHPFRTLQAAVDEASTNTSLVVIKAAPGIYAEGGAECCGVTNRVVIPNAPILIKSTGGAAVTTIRGAADPDATSTNFPGCGPAAIRCVALEEDLDNNAAIQGFTLADGRSGLTKDDVVASVANMAAGVCAYKLSKASTRLQILDCTFTNCIASYAAVLAGGVYQRCRATDCRSYGGLTINCFLSSCLFDSTCDLGPKPDGSTANGNMYCSDTRTFHSTLVNGAAYSGTSNQRNEFSSLFVNFAAKYSGTATCYYYGTVFGPLRAPSSRFVGVNQAETMNFADEATGDYRLVSDCDAVGLGTLPTTSDSYYATWANNYSEFVTAGLDGKRIHYFADGKPLAGCFQSVATKTVLSVPYGGMTVTGMKPGTSALADGASVTVTFDPYTASRPCIGYTLNDVTNLFADAESKTYAYEELCKESSLTLTALYSNDWYVNANTDPTAGAVGSDDYAGISPKYPKRTLQGAMDAPGLLKGDTVHAAAGRYDDGESDAAGSTHPPSRVSIPEGVTLVADEGAEKTFIVGHLGTDDYTDALGCGSNSVRCVTMAKNTVLKGFTLTEGSAYPANGQSYTYSAPYNHGAVMAYDRGSTFVCDSVISNCAAYNAAVGREVTFVNSLIISNRATLGVFSEVNLLGSVVDGNYAGNSSLYRWTQIFDSTIGPHAYKLDGTDGTAVGTYSSSSSRMANTLVLGKCSSGKTTIPVSNCVFIASKATGGILKNASNCWAVAESEAVVDADLRPVAGANVACDHADASLVPSDATLTGYLTPLRTRANNGGRLDIGALEADWRERYGADLATRGRIQVSAADKMVMESATRTVLVPEGTSVTGSFVNTSGRTLPFALRFNVPEDGSLRVTLGDVEKTFGQGEHTYEIKVEEATLPLAFESLAGTAELLAGSSRLGMMLIFK